MTTCNIVPGYEIVHPMESLMLAAEPGLGASDASECLDNWTRYFCNAAESDDDVLMTPQRVSALVHTLVAARQRARRLIAERDALKRAANTEVIRWIDASEQLPDADIDVMVKIDDESVPIWIGHHDGEVWYVDDSWHEAVTHWAEMPFGPEVAS
ncbi:DUF551 domain-containing protein [Allorhodopirellula heiligendammensis]|uniref:DUF551 domain-containing protein n=1 Tax=Allorhodopirellula heiligendammensis TaxID=2714739 RepID=A0A5C6C2Y6_9BACT|nr:DUF551 domain-containing protein [Allorhodopirellula heiligendammensis]TWU18021.1 hypothetical protein Poly21_01740 [Allorhodopirellula heiligendammensis]